MLLCQLMMSPNQSFAKGKVRQRKEFVSSFFHKLRVHSVAVDVPFANTRADPVAPAPTAKLDALEMRILPAGVSVRPECLSVCLSVCLCVCLHTHVQTRTHPGVGWQ